MKVTVDHKTFIKKYWVYIILSTLFLVLAAISIDVWYSNGNIQAIQTNIFDINGSIQTVNNYKYNYEHPFLKVLSIFLYSFSMSILISLFILKVIQKDEDKQRELKDEARRTELFKNVFKGVFDRLIPSEIFDVIKSDILEANIVRRKVKWTFDFIVDKEENTITLQRNVMYEAHNLTSKACKEPFSYIFSSTDYSSTEIEFLKWHDINDKGTTQIAYIDKDATKSELTHIPLGNDIIQVKKDINIPHDKIIFINFKSKEIYKNCINYLHETHFSSACSIGWELQVNFPKEYEFSIIPVFSGNINTIVDDEDRKEYTYSGGILKGQGIEFTLSKKETKIPDIEKE